MTKKPMRRCYYCLAPLERGEYEAHPACEDRQRTILLSPEARRVLALGQTPLPPPEGLGERNARIFAAINENPDVTYQELGRRFGVSAQTISNVARSGGIHRHETKHRADTITKKRTVVEELLRGTPVKTIARTLGMTVGGIYRYRSLLGLK